MPHEAVAGVSPLKQGIGAARPMMARRKSPAASTKPHVTRGAPPPAMAQRPPAGRPPAPGERREEADDFGFDEATDAGQELQMCAPEQAVGRMASGEYEVAAEAEGGFQEDTSDIDLLSDVDEDDEFLQQVAPKSAPKSQALESRVPVVAAPEAPTPGGTDARGSPEPARASRAPERPPAPHEQRLVSQAPAEAVGGAQAPTDAAKKEKQTCTFRRGEESRAQEQGGDSKGTEFFWPWPSRLSGPPRYLDRTRGRLMQDLDEYLPRIVRGGCARFRFVDGAQEPANREPSVRFSRSVDIESVVQKALLRAWEYAPKD